MIQTRVTALLEAHGIPYRLLPHDEPVFTVEAAAAQRGVRADEMVKCILLRESRQRRYVMACVPGLARLDPKAVRSHLGEQEWKRLTFASGAEIEAVTGYVQGAVTPLALQQQIPVIFDHSIRECERVNISSGDPTAGLELDPHALAALAGATFAAIVEQ